MIFKILVRDEHIMQVPFKHVSIPINIVYAHSSTSTTIMVKLKENLFAIKVKSLISLSHGLIIPPKNKVFGSFGGI